MERNKQGFDCSSKMETKGNPPRRFSTGNSNIQITEPKPIPNYLRASIGSCHDLCKYGLKPNFQTKSLPSPKQDNNNANMLLEEKSDRNYRGKKVLASTKVPVSSRQQHSQEKNASTHHHPAAGERLKRAFFKGSRNIRVPRNDAGKDRIRTSKKSSSLPLASSSSLGSSVKVPTTKSRTPKKVLKMEIKNCVEKSETEKTNYENVPEKIIHVIEPKDGNQNEVLAQNRKMDSNTSKATRGGRVIQEEKDSSPRKLKFSRGKVLEIPKGDNGSIDKNLVNKNGEEKFPVHQTANNIDSTKSALRCQDVEQRNRNPGLYNTVIEETANKLVKMRNGKVKALVGAFETVIKIQDSESLIEL